MSRPILISSALVLGIITTVGWAFEIPFIDGTVGSSDLIYHGAFIGAIIGLLVGVAAAFKGKTFIGKFQAIASSIIVCTGLFGLLAHYTNRTIGSGNPVPAELRVKQVTKMWKGRGLSLDQYENAPDGYYLFFETEDGLIRLHKVGPDAPDIGPTRTLPVLKEPGYWGYPRYSLPE